MNQLLDYSALAFYAASLGFYVWHLYGNERLIGRVATTCLSGGVVLHYLALMARARAVGSVPYQDLYGSMSLFGWLLAATYLGIERFHRQRAVGPFVLPFVLLFVAAEAFFSPRIPLPHPAAQGPLFALHVTSNILASAAFALSFVLSVLYLVQNRHLRDHRVGTVIFRFPALEVLELMSRSSVTVGVCALGFGMALGSVWAHRLMGRYVTGDPKEIFSVLTLLIYLGYLGVAQKTSWRGARSSVLCVANFLVVIFNYTVVNFYLSKYHRFF